MDSVWVFVTIRGRPVFAPHVQKYWTGGHDRNFTAFLNREYRRIISTTSGYIGSILHFKTIGAVEFQTWTLNNNTWTLAEVDSIPENLSSRTNLSHFSYQLRHTYEKATRWSDKLDKLMITATYVHTSSQSGAEWSFRIHIIEIIDAQSLYVALFGAIFLSATGGLVYGFLRSDFGAGFGIASFVITCLSLLLALFAAADYIGMETPDSFSAMDVYTKGMQVRETDFDRVPVRSGK